MNKTKMKDEDRSRKTS